MKKPKCPFSPEDLEHKGFTWVLANFHTHTPGSRDYAKNLIPNGTHTHMDIARGILEDCRKQGVMVIAITDHNSPSFVRVKTSSGKLIADPETESYYAMMRKLVETEPGKYGGILVLPGVEIGAENIHVLGFFPPSDDPGWDVLKIAAILDEGNCPPDFYGDHLKSCTDFSIADAIDIIHERGGIAIPAHIDGASGFLKEENQKRLLQLIVSRPHLFAVEYLKDTTRVKLEKLISSTNWKDIFAAREGRPIAWTQSCDAHFVQTYDANQDGNGKAIGTPERRTWLRLDPAALSFESVRTALLDPQNRVRVDKTSRPRERQGAYNPIPSDRTYVRAVRLNWGHKDETLRFNEGINVIVGPPKAGKTARFRSFSVIAGTNKDLCVSGPKSDDVRSNGAGPCLEYCDMILECSVGTTENALWWLHREDKEHIYVARIEKHKDKLKVHPNTKGNWVNLYPGGKFDPYALRNYFKELFPNQPELIPVVPQGFSLDAMEAMFRDPVRMARFIEWHYLADKDTANHRKLHMQLQQISLNPGTISVDKLASKLNDLFKKLQKPRQKAREALQANLKNSEMTLSIKWKRGSWQQVSKRKQVAQKLLAMQTNDPDAVFEVLKSIEDQAEIQLKLKTNPKTTGHSERVKIAIKGLLLVIGARDLGAIILDALGAYFEPVELVKTLAPLMLQARDTGTQFIVSIDDTNFPFAVDADMLFVCQRNSKKGYISPLNDEATGGLASDATAKWALRNLDGGGELFARRMQHYAEVLGKERAKHQKKVADLFLSLSKSKRHSGPRGK